jgi:hypothetical protein
MKCNDLESRIQDRESNQREPLIIDRGKRPDPINMYLTPFSYTRRHMWVMSRYTAMKTHIPVLWILFRNTTARGPRIRIQWRTKPRPEVIEQTHFKLAMPSTLALCCLALFALPGMNFYLLRKVHLCIHTASLAT